jgi:hypothetical protein
MEVESRKQVVGFNRNRAKQVSGALAIFAIRRYSVLIGVDMEDQMWSPSRFGKWPLTEIGVTLRIAKRL